MPKEPGDSRSMMMHQIRDDDRQDVVEPGDRRGAGARQFQDRRIGRIDDKIVMPGRQPEQDQIAG